MQASNPSLQQGYRDSKRSDEAWRQRRDEIDDGIVEDVNVPILYKSHRLLALVCLASFLAIGFRRDNGGMVENTMTACRAGAGFILVLGALVFPRGPFIRPHPVIWRLVFAFLVIYELVLILLLYQNKKDARKLLWYVDDALNIPLEEKEYATNCEVTWRNIVGQFDIFVLCHGLGWLLKALVLRDRLILWHMSITWEFLEMSLSYMLPNFAECWWDHWVMDVLLCNGVGIELGIWICKYLEVKEYKWHSIFEYKTLCGKVNRTILQFTPESWIRVEWDYFRNVRRYMEIHIIMIAFQLIDLNSFFLKRLLWIPTKHSVNAVRLLLLCTVGLVVIRQYYVLVTHPTYKRVGMHSWLFYIVLATELLLIIKLSEGEFPDHMPDNVRLWLYIGGTMYVLLSALGLLYASCQSYQHEKDE